MRIGSLFSGTLALDMAAEEFFGGSLAWVSDIDPGACKILAHRAPAVPNLGDITRIDWAAVEPVEGLTAGWPCQPFSLAGKRKGALDERALWPYVARAIRILQPRFVVLENVAAIATAGELARAVGDLSALGYDAQWMCLRAADVGAAHGRARVFILATNAEPSGLQGVTISGVGRAGIPASSGRIAANAGSGGRREEDPRGRHMVRQSSLQNGRDEGSGSLRPHRDAAADTNGDSVRQQSVSQLRGGGASIAGLASTLATADTEGDPWRLTHRNGRAVADTDSSGLGTHISDLRAGQPDIAWGSYEPAIRRWEHILGRLAPPPTETSPRGSQRLSPRFVEWMMGLPEGWVTDVPGLNRNAQLKALGNGVVPQQALAALQLMELGVAA